MISPTPVVLCGLLMCLVGPTPDAAGQTAAEPDSAGLPVSIERIRKGLEHKPLVTLEETKTAQPTFRIRVEERLPPQPLFRSDDVSVGVLPPGPMSHYEFLRMVTPETARPYAAFNQKELAIVTATTIANAFIAKAAAAGIRTARRSIQQRRLEGLRREIASELAAIEAANAARPRPDNVRPNTQHATPAACSSSPGADGSHLLTGER